MKAKSLILILSASLFTGTAYAQNVEVLNTTMACTNLETFDGLKMVEAMMGPDDLKHEINHVLNTGACKAVRAGQVLKLLSDTPSTGVMGGQFYRTNQGYIATSNVRVR